MLDKMDKKKQLVEELLAHLDESQGGDLAGLVEGAKPKAVSIEKIDVMPKHPMDTKVDDAIDHIGKSPLSGDESAEDPAEEASESPAMEASEDSGEQMSDEELKELLQKYLA
jgi:hypothetical protein